MAHDKVRKRKRENALGLMRRGRVYDPTLKIRHTSYMTAKVCRSIFSARIHILSHLNIFCLDEFLISARNRNYFCVTEIDN